MPRWLTCVPSAPDRQVQELFRRHHVLRANCAEELLAMALGAQATRPWGSRLATITASGGQIGLVLDEAANVGLKHAELTGATRSLLRSKLPSFVDVRNPVDYWGVEDPATGFREVLRIVAEDPNVDVVVIPESDLNAYPTHYPGSGESSKLDSVAAVAASVEKAFAVVGCVAGDARPELVEQMLERNVLLFSGLPPAFKALSVLFGRRISQDGCREAT